MKNKHKNQNICESEKQHNFLAPLPRRRVITSVTFNPITIFKDGDVLLVFATENLKFKIAVIILSISPSREV